MLQTNPQYLVLHGATTSLVLELPPNEAPLWRYWGPRLPDNATPGPALRDTRPAPSYILDFDQPLSVAPVFGVGWFGQAALLAHRRGQAFAQQFTRCEVVRHEGNNGALIKLVDPVAHVQLDLTLKLDPKSDVLTFQTTLRNTGSDSLEVQWLAAATLPLPTGAATVRCYVGQHNHEFLLQETPLTRSTWRLENRRGRTSHDAFPAAVVTTPGATEHTGLVYGAYLAWSGNASQSIEWMNDGRYHWMMGEWLAPGEVSLAAGESWASPEVVAACSTAGLNGLAHSFHTELRSRLNWPGGTMSPRKVHLNTWEGLFFDVQPNKVKALAMAAAKIGIERYVLDDGWFNARHHDRAGLGDWWPDAGKYPNGLGDLIAHVNALGMEFGLWFEPEMVSPDSDVFRAHPDWALQLAGRPLITGRNQLVFDISRREVADYLFEKISTLLTAHPIRYIKWDHNRDLTTAGLADGTPGYSKQVKAVYSLLARVRTAHPDVEIESCSGGGGRIDFGILRHTHRVWTSDCIDALSRVDIQRGFLQFFPPEIMGSHIGTAPAHTTGRSHSLAFRAAVAMTGHLGVELDARTFENATSAEIKAWIELYKRLRDQLHHGSVWQGECGDHLLWQAHGDDGAERITLFVYRTQPSSFKYNPTARLPMLRPEIHYRVRRIVPTRADGTVSKGDHGDGFAPNWPLFDAISGEGVDYSGAWLKQAGLPVPRGNAETCWIVEIKRV